KGVIHLVRDVIDAARDVIHAVGDLYIGILSGNLCRIIRGGADLITGSLRLGFDTGFGFLPWAGARAVGSSIGGFRDEIDQYRLERLIRRSLANAFDKDDDRVKRAIKKIGINVRPMGLPFHIDARRMFLNSENATFNPKTLHDAGVINLYRMAGYWSDCAKSHNDPDTKVVYTGTNLHVTYADLGTYLANGPGSTTAFRVYAITRVKFRTHLETAQRKMQVLGVRLFYEIGEIEATLPEHVPFNAGTFAVQQALFAAAFGRDASGRGLDTIPVVSLFSYVGLQDFGLTTTFNPSKNERNISGVTYRNLTPDWGLRFVLAHELGHYVSLDHKNRAGGVRALDEIMYVGSSHHYLEASTPFEYLLLEGEPRFTFDDARTVWEWITSPTVRDILLP